MIPLEGVPTACTASHEGLIGLHHSRVPLQHHYSGWNLDGISSGVASSTGTKRALFQSGAVTAQTECELRGMIVYASRRTRTPYSSFVEHKTPPSHVQQLYQGETDDVQFPISELLSPPESAVWLEKHMHPQHPVETKPFHV